MNRPGPTAPNPPGPGPGLAWLLGSTRNRLLAGLLVALLVSGALLTLTAVSIGRQSVRHAQENDARRLATLFEASLHNAMLQRDLAGLGHLLQTLGDAPGVARAGLLDIRGEVRFASDPAWLATTHTDRLAGLCLSAACPGQATAQIQWRPGTSGPALRIGISNGLWKAQKARISPGWAADACLDGLELAPGPLPCLDSARPDGSPRARWALISGLTLCFPPSSPHAGAAPPATGARLRSPL
jgi:hypothetical protein